MYELTINIRTSTDPHGLLYQIREDIKEIEVTICEECWYDVFDCGENYQYTD